MVVSLQDESIPSHQLTIHCAQRIQYLRLSQDNASPFDLYDMEALTLSLTHSYCDFKVNGVDHHVPPAIMDPVLFKVMTDFGFRHRGVVDRCHQFFIQNSLVNTPLSYMVGQALPFGQLLSLWIKINMDTHNILFTCPYDTLLQDIRGLDPRIANCLENALATLLQRLSPSYPLIFSETYLTKLTSIIRHLPIMARSLHRFLTTADASSAFHKETQDLVTHAQQHLIPLLGMTQPDQCTQLTIALYYSAKNTESLRQHRFTRPKAPNADQVVQQLWSHH
ncbi:hypothetical protein DM01DRAFT_1374661 [Hesseltinella vesiculosa]|uniref:Uncharacterized protein n=1 Tax=Hesseltinella vesiculosa TaxID=101127 RepID=A0A1X2GGN4_9FUNG|nr:hypothetical protein DM01DRAFT_1374661 [Hesseltinella vesiculosa]